MRSDTKQWVGSSLFFHCIERIGLNEEIYYIPVGMECDNSALTYYCEALFDALGRLELTYTDSNKEAKDYVMKVAFILRGWARQGHGIKVV